MTQLDRYITRTLLSSVSLVMVALLMLGMLFVFIGEQASVGIGHYTMLDALLYAAMSMPQFAVESFPAAALIGALLGVGILARSNEITVMRASGMSKLRLCLSVLISSTVLIGAAVLIGEFLAQPLAQLADAQKALAKYANASYGSLSGAWVRDGDTILNAQARSSPGEFGGMLIFELSPDNSLVAVGRAERATATGPQSWQLRDYSESRFTGDSVTSLHAPERNLRTTAGADFLQLAVTDPGELALRTLYPAIRYLRSNHLDANPYEIVFWSRIASTLGILVAMLFALPFGFGSLRSASLSARTTFGVALGVIYIFMQRMVESGTQVFQLDPVILSGVPTGLLAIAAAIMLWRVR